MVGPALGELYGDNFFGALINSQKQLAPRADPRPCPDQRLHSSSMERIACAPSRIPTSSVPEALEISRALQRKSQAVWKPLGDLMADRFREEIDHHDTGDD